MEKSYFFSKKSKNFQISKFRSDRSDRKNSFSEKFFYEVFISIRLLGESMFKKSAKSEMVTGRLVDFYKKKPLSNVLK
jgi:hypothetical protein